MRPRGEARRDAPGAIATSATSAEAIETDGGTATVTTGLRQLRNPRSPLRPSTSPMGPAVASRKESHAHGPNGRRSRPITSPCASFSPAAGRLGSKSAAAGSAKLPFVPAPEYDAVVVGAGPNGLTAAALLATAGRSVLAARSRRADRRRRAHRGADAARATSHDVCSAIHPLAAGSPAFAPLDARAATASSSRTRSSRSRTHSTTAPPASSTAASPRPTRRSVPTRARWRSTFAPHARELGRARRRPVGAARARPAPPDPRSRASASPRSRRRRRSRGCGSATPRARRCSRAWPRTRCCR